MALTYRDKLRLVKDIEPGATWVNIKTGRTATVVMRSDMDLVIEHQSGRQTKKQDHYFAANFEPKASEASTVESVDASKIHLSPNEKEWLVKMSAAPRKTLKLIDAPNVRALNGLIRKGMATSVHATFWTITDLGVQRCTTIY